MQLKLGKLPARPGAVNLRFGAFFDARKLPTPPARFGHYAVGQPWGVLANNDHSCCVFSGAAHEEMIWRHEAKKPQPGFRDQDVLADYSAVTGFDPAKPETDQGADMQVAASYRRKTGILDSSGARSKIDGYVALRAGDERDLALATYLTGAVGVGLQFPESAWDQFDAEEPWQIVPGSPVNGGHYVPCVGRNSNGDFLVITWGRIHAMAPEFYAKYCDEAVSYISLQILDTRGLTPEGFAADQFQATVAALAA